jgi:hypothetical protein
MVLHAVRAESSLEEIDNAAMFELARLNLKQIVGECEKPDALHRQRRDSVPPRSSLAQSMKEVSLAPAWEVIAPLKVRKASRIDSSSAARHSCQTGSRECTYS